MYFDRFDICEACAKEAETLRAERDDLLQKAKSLTDDFSDQSQWRPGDYGYVDELVSIEKLLALRNAVAKVEERSMTC